MLGKPQTALTHYILSCSKTCEGKVQKKLVKIHTSYFKFMLRQVALDTIHKQLLTNVEILS